MDGFPAYAELHCHSTFSLLDGASEPEALVARAQALGFHALALTDHDDVGGAVRFATAARAAALPGILGAELTVDVPLPATLARTPPGTIPGVVVGEDQVPRLRTHLVCLAETREGWGHLCTLITRARLDHPRGEPRVTLDQLTGRTDGLFALSGCPRGWVPRLLALGAEGRLPADVAAREARAAAGTLAEGFGGRFAIECWDHALAEERVLVQALIPLAAAVGVPWVVTADAHYATPAQRRAHDVLTALRHGATLDEMGTRLRPNAEWHLTDRRRLAARWRGREAGLAATVAVAERCAFRLETLRPRLPHFPLPPGVGEDAYLAQLVETGATERWGAQRTPAHDRQLATELALIARLGLAGYFLIVWDIVRFARREGILCQGRGSAANSAVCYCLGITAVDPIALDLLFARFLSEERTEAPDIDIDFAHRERERVLQYVYARYGREHAAMVCEHITWRGRSAVRDAARVLGCSPAQAAALAAQQPRHGGYDALGPANYAKRAFDATPAATDAERGRATRGAPSVGATAAPESPESPESPAGPTVERHVAEIVGQLHGAPRHRGIHVGGFVLTAEPLHTVVPIEPASMEARTVIQWEKDDLDPVGLVKIDLLGLGILTVLQDCLAAVRQTRGVTIDLGQLDCADPAIYDDLCRADTVGVFQVESRAQMNTLPRLKPRCFYDLVVEVALIRPGPIQGAMVHPYLRRRAGTEDVTYPHPSLEPILRRTLGVPLFQEQGMQVAITAAGFTPGEADQLRKAMGHKRSRERMSAIAQRMIDGMARHGIPADVAQRIYDQIQAFADYGFPESHAASFALLVYASAYLRHYYAPEFLCAMLNAQPMGFYAPGTLIEDAKRHGVRVRPVDVTRSHWDHTLEPGDGPRAAPAVRLGLRAVHGLGAHARARLEAALVRRDAPDLGAGASGAAHVGAPFVSIADVVDRTRLDRRALRALAEAGAFDAFVAEEPPARRRRVALWRVLEAERGGWGPFALFPETAPPAHLPGFTPPELTEADYRLTGVSLAGHPLRHLRALLAPNGVQTARALHAMPDGARVAHAGLVICRQRPGTAKGFTFLTLEDETGTINIVVRPATYERDRDLIVRSPILLVRGVLQVESGVYNIRADTFAPLHAGAGEAAVKSHDFR
ncbi:MAG: DNA polymerase III subunit alpha [Gemmatimonadota bacterium]|nr:DNA polymerase III subunit alpha [Gemmatimonadota bacterium]